MRRRQATCSTGEWSLAGACLLTQIAALVTSLCGEGPCGADGTAACSLRQSGQGTRVRRGEHKSASVHLRGGTCGCEMQVRCMEEGGRDVIFGVPAVSFGALFAC